MLRPTRLELRNFRGWKHGVVELDAPLVALVAANRRGKSSTLNALEWCLFGDLVEKKASGIAERADWQVQHRGESGVIEVALTLAGQRAPARILRRRDPAAGARAEDRVIVEMPSGARVEGEQARAWLRHMNMPDWDAWRRAFCQHQENARTRLTDGADRSTILSALLGLEGYDRLGALLREQKPAGVIKELDELQAQLEEQVLRLARRPEEDLSECERRAEALGVERARIGPALALEVAQRMLERACRLGADLGVDAALPECSNASDARGVAAWAESWAHSLRNERRSSERSAELARRRGALATALERFEPAEARWKRAREALEREAREHGDEATQVELLAQAAQALKRAEDELRAESASLALLRDARELLKARHDGAPCPVCASEVPALARQLDDALAAGRGERSVALENARRGALERHTMVETQVRSLRAAARDEAEARRAVDATRGALNALVPEGRRARTDDLLAAAREEAAAVEADARTLQAALAERDRELDLQRSDHEVLRALLAWQDAADRAAHRTALDGSPGWSALQAALDDAAAFALDLEALGALAREAQAARSAQRESEVNRTLGEFFALITGDASGQSVRVRVKRTPKGLSYDLEDDAGERALSTLNQASLNALSLALLFAQAEERARSGWPTWVVLDDPGQSLDAEHQAGLARALERVAAQCTVIVGTPPGPLAEQIAAATLAPRVWHFEPWDARYGVRLATEAPR